MRNRRHLSFIAPGAALALVLVFGPSAPRINAAPMVAAPAVEPAPAPVADAAMKGDLNTVRALLKDGAAPSTPVDLR